MTGRNEPCRCGSGMKYKKCCGKNTTKGGSPQVAVNQPPKDFMSELYRRQAERDRLERLAMRRQQFR